MMDNTKINNLKRYLTTSQLPEDLNEKEKAYIIKNAHKFTVNQDTLYFVSPFDAHCYKKVLNDEDAKQAFIQYHYHPSGGHLAYSNTFNRIYMKYY